MNEREVLEAIATDRVTWASRAHRRYSLRISGLLPELITDDVEAVPAEFFRADSVSGSRFANGPVRMTKAGVARLGALGSPFAALQRRCRVCSGQADLTGLCEECGPF